MEREIFGHWSTTNKGPVEGRLVVDESGEIALELRGYLIEAHRVSGQLSDGSPATLFDVGLMRRDPDADFPEEYRVGTAVLGLEVHDLEDRGLAGARRRLGGLEEVTGISGLSIEIPDLRSERRHAKVEWQGTDPIEVALPVGALRLIDFVRFEHESDFNFALRHIAEAKLHTEELLSIDEIEGAFDILAGFLAFALEARVDVGTLLVHPEGKAEESASQAEILTKSRPLYGRSPAEVEPWLTLDRLSNPSDVLAGFFRFAREQSSAYLILFELQVFFAALNPIDRLLYLARFLEVYHRTRFPGFRDSEEIHEEREALVREALGEKHKAWAAHILHHSNEIFFKERIIDLLEGPAVAAVPVTGGEPTEFAKLLGDCRNYWTHYSPELKSKALHDVELDQFTDRVLLVVRACVLDDIGVAQLEATAALERDWRWQRYEGLALTKP